MILFFIATIPWLNILFESIEIPGLLKVKYNDDHAQHYVESKEPKSENEEVIKFKSQKIIALPSNSWMKKFSLKARINYETEAGSTYLMKLFVNNVLIEGWRLENKEKIKKYMDGREFNWYHDIHKTWNLQYSPSFESNAKSSKYRVINGNAYEFVFNIADITLIDNKYEITISHLGREDRIAHKNSIVVKDLKIF